MADQTWGSLIGGIHKVAQRPHFSSAPRNPSTGSRLPSSPIIRSTQSIKTQKMSQSFSNNISSFNTIVNNVTAADDRSNILAWLSQLNPKLRHQDIRDRRVEDVGEWLLQTEEFRGWHAGSGGGKSDNAVLFCYGIRGWARLLLGNKGKPP